VPRGSVRNRVHDGPLHSARRIRDLVSSILGSAVTYGLLVKNPAEGVRLSPGKKGNRIKPYIDPA
jgi:hypothetical protein